MQTATSAPLPPRPGTVLPVWGLPGGFTLAIGTNGVPSLLPPAPVPAPDPSSVAGMFRAFDLE